MWRIGGKILKAFQYQHVIYQITPLVTLNKKYTNYYLFELIVNYYDEITPLVTLNKKYTNYYLFELIVNYYNEKCLQLNTLLLKRLVLKLYVTVQFKLAILE